MDRAPHRRPRAFRPAAEPCEARVTLSHSAAADPVAHVLHLPGVAHPVRPNTPVLPFGEPSATATFIDPSARIDQGKRIVIGHQTYVAPYATLDGSHGYIRIGGASAILDNARLVANSARNRTLTGITIGDRVVIAQGARVFGQSTIGAYGPGAEPVYIGPNAIIDGATIAPGAFVSALARVGPGITVPAGLKVLPGANITTEAEATNPALGKVAKITAADLAVLSEELMVNPALASGYTSVYQGSSATGASPGVTTSGIFNGALNTVEGTSREPGPRLVSFEPKAIGPQFLVPHRGVVVEGLFTGFRARVIGQAIFHEKAAQVAHRLGRSDSIRADVGQPLTFQPIGRLGNAVSIHAPLKGSLTVGPNFRADDRAVILGGPNAIFGANVHIGAGAVVAQSSLGNNVTIGPSAYVAGSTLPANTVVPPGAIVINNRVMGTVQS